MWFIARFARFLPASLIVAQAHAYTATVTPNVTVDEGYTDNVNLATGSERDEEFVTQINPGVAVIVDGPRATTDVRYVMQNIIYGSDVYEDKTFHQFQGRGTLEVVAETGYVDVAGSYAQRAIDPAEASPFDNVSITGNRTDVWSTSVSPYVQHQIGTSAKSELRYAKDRVEYSDDSVDESDSDRWALVVGSIDQGDDISWETVYKNEKTTANGRDVRFESAELDVGFQVSAKVRLLGRFGGENNEFIHGDEEIPEGRFWHFGARWDPSSRTEILLLVGERYFGDTYEWSVRRRGHYFNAEVAYSETLTTAALSDLVDLAIVTSVSGNEPAAPELSVEVYVRKNVRGTIGIKKGKMESELTFHHEKRDYVITDDVEVDAIDARWKWNVLPKSTVDASLRWRKYRGGDDEDNSEQRSLRIGFNKALSSSAFAYLYTEQAKRIADVREDEYTQNSIHVGLTKRFR